MLIWLASYPKSGNTLLRSMLASYFFSSDGSFDFKLLKNIKQFPSNQFFKNLGINTNDDKEVLKNYINAQSKINKKNSIQFVKTHSGLYKLNGYSFTDLNNTLGVIYIVRDPRNLIESFSRHYQFSIEESLDYMINGLTLKRNVNHPMTFVGSWKQNYESWKKFEISNKYLLIKYEDLVFNKKAIFIKILEFIKKLSRSKFLIDYTKIENVLNSTSFENMQKLEKEHGFTESATDKKTKEKITFFKFGPKVNRQNLVKHENIKKIETVFDQDLKFFGYI